MRDVLQPAASFAGTPLVMVGLVPTIHPTACSDARGVGWVKRSADPTHLRGTPMLGHRYRATQPTLLEHPTTPVYPPPMPAFICTACGTQYPPSAAPPGACPVCTDERQFVPASGQSWTTLEGLRKTHSNKFRGLAAGLTTIETT